MLTMELKAAEKEFIWTSCVDDVLATVANYYHLDYRFSYARAWRFQYTPWTNDCITKMGERINTNDVEYRYPFLEECHGIRIVKHTGLSLEQIISLAEEELKLNRPCAIHMDSYYLPWDFGYQQMHTNHVCIPLEIGKETITLMDPYNYREKMELSRVHLKESTHFCLTFEIHPVAQDYSPVKTMQEVLKEMLGEQNVFDQMRQFALDLKEHLNLKEEFADTQGNFHWSKLHLNLTELAFGRSFARQAVLYLAKVTESNKLIECSNHFRRMVSRFNFGISMMQRAIRPESCESEEGRKKIAKVLEEVSDLFIQEADFEQNTAQLLLQELERLNDEKEKERQTELITGKEYKTTEKVDIQQHYVNLEKYWNNTGFGTMREKKSADFTCEGEFYLWNADMREFQWKDGQITYKFPMIGSGKPDNIACSGQRIEVSGVDCSKIALLAAAEWGSYYEEITMLYEDGYQEKYYFGFTDFAFGPRYGEHIAYEGPTAKKIQDEIKSWQKSAKIFSIIKAVRHGKVKAILLPKCERVHIFAITLVSENGGVNDN